MAQENSSNNANNSLTSNITIDPGSVLGDAFVQFNLGSTAGFTVGVDDSDSDSFVVASGSALGTNNAMRIASTGEVNFPKQPSFQAYLSSTQISVTGNGTAYTVPCNSEIFDLNGDYNTSTYTFTAPVTGRYVFTYHISLRTDSSSGGDYWVSSVVTSNREYFCVTMPTTNRVTGSFYYGSSFVYLGFSGTCFADMDASDTAYLRIKSSGGSKLDDVAGGSQRTYFMGYLACLGIVTGKPR